MNTHKTVTGLYRLYLVILTIVVFSGYSQNVFAQAEKRLIREGNRLYQKEQFDESELSYRRALENEDDLPQARFNLGNSLFKQERYDEAIRYFGELAGEIEDPENLSKVYHNLGNSMLMSQQIEKSIDAYKEALRNNPGDAETRYNLAYAQHLLDEMEDQQQDQDEEGDGDDDNQQDNDDGQNDDQEQTDNDDGQDDEQEQQDNNDGQDDEQEQQDNNDGQDDEQEQQDSGENDQNEGNEPQPEDQQEENQQDNQQPQPDRITAEDALRMLQAAERDEQRVQEKLMESKSSEEQARSGRNW